MNFPCSSRIFVRFEGSGTRTLSSVKAVKGEFYDSGFSNTDPSDALTAHQSISPSSVIE